MSSRARGKHARRARSWPERLLVAACVLVALCLVAALGLWGYVQFRYGQIATVRIPGLKSVVAGQPFNVLVVGSDSRASVSSEQAAFGSNQQVGGQRSDVTLILHVDPGLHRLSILSIPRDLFVPIAGTNSSNRINAAFSSGPEQLVETIQSDFQIPVQHYVLIDFAGFQGLVNDLGGINLNFPYPSKDAFSGLNITRAGCQHLDGAGALAVARSRHFYYLKGGYWHYDGQSDISRIRRQHVFLKVVVQTAVDQGLTNPIKANSFIGSAVHDVTIDSGLSISELVDLARQLSSIKAADIPTYTMPSRPVSNYQGFGDVLFPVQPDAQATVAAFLGTSVPAPTTTAPPPGAPTTSAPSPAARSPVPTVPPQPFDPTAC